MFTSRKLQKNNIITQFVAAKTFINKHLHSKNQML